MVTPVNVFVPDKVNVPEPALVKLPDPLITPDITRDVVVSPFVSVIPLASSILPAPASDLIVSVASTSYIAPKATDTSVVSAKVPVVCSVPSLIIVSPE